VNPTFVACLTPPGTAALATLTISGPAAWTIVRAVFEPTLPAEPQPGKFWLGRIGNELGRDEVVLAVKANAPCLSVEIHCHGGQQVLQWLLEILESHGAVAGSPRDFPGSFASMSAMEALTHAPTVRTAGILLDQFHGACSRAVAVVATHREQGRTAEARTLLDLLISRIPLGQHLVAPWRVVIAGAVNAGKSSLVNALTGHTRSIVSPQPGTTRDVVTTRLALDGWPVELADTAGWRTAGDALEEAGIARARAALEQADLIVWVLDGSTTPVFPDVSWARILFVISKVDLPVEWDASQVRGAVRVSARTGVGVSELCQRIADLLVPNPPGPGEGVPFTQELMDQLLIVTTVFV